MGCVRTPISVSQSPSSWAINSGLLSERMYSGSPRSANSAANTAFTCSEGMERPTSTAFVCRRQASCRTSARTPRSAHVPDLPGSRQVVFSPRSASARIATIGASVNRLFFMLSSSYLPTSPADSIPAPGSSSRVHASTSMSVCHGTAGPPRTRSGVCSGA